MAMPWSPCAIAMPAICGWPIGRCAIAVEAPGTGAGCVGIVMFIGTVSGICAVPCSVVGEGFGGAFAARVGPPFFLAAGFVALALACAGVIMPGMFIGMGWASAG